MNFEVEKGLMEIADKIIKQHLEGLTYSQKKGVLSYINFEIEKRLEGSLKWNKYKKKLI